jgi:hypothetical protein
LLLPALLIAVVSLHAQAAERGFGQCEEVLSGRRITLVVPYAPGGGWDAYARLFAPVLESLTGARVSVRNLPGAGGMLGIRAVAEARPESLTLGIFNPTALIDTSQHDPGLPQLDAILTLGSLVTDSLLFVGREDFNLATSSTDTLVLGVIETELVRTLLAVEALRWDVKPVVGFSGSAERFLALLRGDVDLVVSSETLASTQQNTPEVKPVLFIGDEQNQVYPAVPFLAGKDGLLDRLTLELPPEERQARMQLAQLAADLSRRPRSISVSSRLDLSMQTCLTDVVEKVLFSDELRVLADRQGLTIAPSNAVTVRSLISTMQNQVANNKLLLDKVSSEYAIGQ